MSLPHDTPVDTPAAEPKTREQRAREAEWDAAAKQYQTDGYNSAVVARKLIEVHAMPAAEAEALVGALYGKKVDARAGDTTSAVVTGLAMCAAGLVGAFVFFMMVGFGLNTLTFIVYAALLGLAGKGASQAFIAMVNR